MMSKYKFISCFVLLCFLFLTHHINAQSNFEDLKPQMSYIEKGELNLLVYDHEGTRRFFVEKKGQLFELSNENYIDKINELTSDRDLNTLRLKYNLKSISRIIKDYNREKSNKEAPLHVGARLGFWGGLSNFTQYPSINEGDEDNLFLGLELEAYGRNEFHRHAAVFQLRKSFPGDVVDLDLTELMIGYRFNAISQKKFMFYFEVELINFGYYDINYTSSSSTEQHEQELLQDTGRIDLDTPFGLGAGIAILLFKGSYLTLGYSNIIQINSARDNFPVDVRAGLKFNL